MYKVFVKFGAGFEDGTYCFDDGTPQREFVTDDEEAARTFRNIMSSRYPAVTYEVHRVTSAVTEVV